MFDKMKNSAESYGVIGLGRFGTALVKTLSDAGKEVIAVDKDEAKVKAVRGWTDYAFVIDELNEAALKETGMQNCGTVTICIGEQVDISILTTMLVTKLGVPHVISKAASEVHGEVLKRLGAEVVYPEADMAVRIGKRPDLRHDARLQADGYGQLCSGVQRHQAHHPRRCEHHRRCGQHPQPDEYELRYQAVNRI